MTHLHREEIIAKLLTDYRKDLEELSDEELSNHRVAIKEYAESFDADKWYRENK